MCSDEAVEQREYIEEEYLDGLDKDERNDKFEEYFVLYEKIKKA